MTSGKHKTGEKNFGFYLFSRSLALYQFSTCFIYFSLLRYIFNFPPLRGNTLGKTWFTEALFGRFFFFFSFFTLFFPPHDLLIEFSEKKTSVATPASWSAQIILTNGTDYDLVAKFKINRQRSFSSYFAVPCLSAKIFALIIFPPGPSRESDRQKRVFLLPRSQTDSYSTRAKSASLEVT